MKLLLSLMLILDWLRVVNRKSRRNLSILMRIDDGYFNSGFEIISTYGKYIFQNAISDD